MTGDLVRLRARIEAQASINRITEPTDRLASSSVVTLADDTPAGAQSRRRASVVRVARPPGGGRTPASSLRRPFPTNSVDRRAGVRREAVHRHAGWVMGEFLDEAVLGLLAREWTP
ncbi:MAG TPA: hypothetical protein VFW65_23870 [Pseudonocardiaceae bacterium]|nr:hypothetical protein [Pseudonocardiaceae bacterium]